METIDIVTIVAATLAALTKIIDNVTTIKKAKFFAKFTENGNVVYMEKNPIGRILFRKFGIAGGCWITFALVVIICTVVAWEAIVDGNFAYKVASIVIFGLLTYGHISAGIHNTTGRQTLIVRVTLKCYGWIGRTFGKK